MRIVLLLLLSLLFNNCYEVERNCAHFKTGTFEFKTLVGTEMLTTTFTRNDTIEIDFFRGKADTSSIRWINDCEYIVKKLNPHSRAETKSIHMKIISSKGDEYIFEYNVVGNPKKQKGKAKKID